MTRKTVRPALDPVCCRFSYLVLITWSGVKSYTLFDIGQLMTQVNAGSGSIDVYSRQLCPVQLYSPELMFYCHYHCMSLWSEHKIKSSCPLLLAAFSYLHLLCILYSMIIISNTWTRKSPYQGCKALGQRVPCWRKVSPEHRHLPLDPCQTL